MDNISKLLEAIRIDGQTEVDKIHGESEKRVGAIRKLYGEEARSQVETIVKRAKKEALETTQRGVSKAGIESRSIKLLARIQALEKAFSRAGEGLAELSTDKKLELYLRLISKYSEAGMMTIILNEEDSKALGKKLIKRIKKEENIDASLSEKAGRFMGGVIIQQGEIETNCTFEVMLEDVKKETEADVAAILFA